MPSLSSFGRSISGYIEASAADILERQKAPTTLAPAVTRYLVRRASLIHPTHDQRTIIIIACFYVIIIAILWNVPYLKLIIYPFKLNTVGLHEFGHAFIGVLTGAKIESIILEPNEGGATKMRGG